MAEIIVRDTIEGVAAVPVHGDTPSPAEPVEGSRLLESRSTTHIAMPDLLHGESATEDISDKTPIDMDDFSDASVELSKKRFLLNLAVALHSYGDTTHRTEYLLGAVADSLGIKADVGAFPNFILVSFLSKDSDPAKSELHHLPIKGGLDVDKLGRMDMLCTKVVKHSVSLDEAWKEMTAIRKADVCFPLWVQMLAYPLSGFSCSLTFFGGGLWDAGIATLGGLVVAGLVLIGMKFKNINRVMEFVSAAFVGFLTRVITGASNADSCFLATSISALVWFLPGLSITQAVTEIASRSMISGVARLVYAVSISLQLGFGLSIGSWLAFWVNSSTPYICHPVAMHWYVLSFFGVAISFNILLNANLAQWPTMTLASAIGLVISDLAGQSLDPNLSTMLAALAIGIFGNIATQFPTQNALSIILSGILVLVPGSVGLRGVNALLQNDAVSGIQFGFSMLLIALSIAIGLIASRIISNSPHRHHYTPYTMAHSSRLREMPPI
eukprot:m.17802 g.17802  ORF g.17802 m.17802 type:complete len:497 (-) comp3276_c0_seq2:334-1824(-)